MKIYIRTNKATTNIFGLHTQPRKTTGYTNILKLVRGGGEKEKEPNPLKIEGEKIIQTVNTTNI